MANMQLREARKRKGLPVEVACRMAGVSLRCWWLWETWGLPPKRREVAQRIAELLGVSLQELGYDSEPQEVKAPRGEACPPFRFRGRGAGMARG